MVSAVNGPPWLLSSRRLVKTIVVIVGLVHQAPLSKGFDEQRSQSIELCKLVTSPQTCCPQQSHPIGKVTAGQTSSVGARRCLTCYQAQCLGHGTLMDYLGLAP